MSKGTYDITRHHAEVIQAYANEHYDGDWEAVTVGETKGILFALCYRKGRRT